jgi:RNA polymerase sigma-70 factor (ECF subfamily)
MMTMSPDRLATRLAADLDGAFPDLVRDLSPGLYSGALRMLGNRSDAEEVTQEALIRAYRALSEYPEHRIHEMRIKGWVWTIAANLCRNRLRSRARHHAVSLDTDDPAAPTPGPEAALLSSEVGGELAAVLLQLPWEMRLAVVLNHVVGLSSAEISAALDRPPATVRSDVHRGLARLRVAYPQSEES